MKILIAFCAWFIFCFAAGWWMASQEHKPEIEKVEISRHGPEKFCEQFKGHPKEFAACFGYE